MIALMPLFKAAALLLAMAVSAQAAPLLIYADGEEAMLTRLARAYEARHPETRIELRLMRAPLLARAVVTAPTAGHGPDLVISGATDRQVKVVNDGYALAHRSEATAALPDWAQWRGELFGFTREETVFALSGTFLARHPPPRSRAALLQLLEADPEAFRRRVHTVHVGLDGTAYAFATFDSQNSPVYWRLIHALGTTHAQPSTSPPELLTRMHREGGMIGWSLARSQSVIELAARLGITLIEPEDFRITALRTAMIPKTAAEPEAARGFLDFLLSSEGQSLIGETALLPTARLQALPRPEALLPLGPESLVFLDEMKRLRFLDNWLDLLLDR